ncbi:hypothetical protein HYU09_01515 [Candidatus Woesearchaeota archaeon]|nr:hypothetical protein [Candidatus Woesearchaeota archaeon]
MVNKEMPPVSRITGINEDYYNEWFSYALIFRTKGKERLAEEIARHPIRAYADYIQQTCGLSLGEEDRKKASELDKIVEEANEKFADSGNFTDEEFEGLIRRVHKMIYGR